MSAPDTDRLEVWREFLISYGALERMLTRALQEECNLALPWFEVMEALHATGGRMRFMELAEKVMVHPSSLSRQLDNMEDAELVAREKLNEEDGRAVTVTLTQIGRDDWRTASVVYDRLVKRVFTNHLTETDVIAMHRVFGKVLEG